MPEIPWRGVAVLEGLTDDGRWYQSVGWRDLPLTLTLHHDDPEVVGRMDTLVKHAGGVVTSTGVFIDTPEGIAAAYLLETQAMRGMSVEIVGDYEFVCTQYEDFGYGPECTDGLAVFPEVTIVKASMVGSPAFGATLMELVPEGEDPNDAAAIERMVVAAVALKPPEPDLPATVVMASLAVPSQLVVPVEPPLAWFEVPEADSMVPLHIEPNGQIFGHIAQNGECHIGHTGRCVTPPVSRSNFAYFNLGRIVALDDDGKPVEIACGQVTMTTGHGGGAGMTMAEVVSHYDNTGTVVGYVRVEQGHHGVWVCGTAKSGIAPAEVVAFNVAKPSGHWVPVHGHNELVAVLMVNSPGFPVVASVGTMTEHGDVERGLILSLPSFDSRRQAAERADVDGIRRDVEQLRAVVAALVVTHGERVWESLAASIAG